MDAEKLKEIISSGENEDIEFKESFHSAQEIAKVICAFANTNGGIILLGVKNNKSVVGLKENLDKVQQKLSAAIQTIHPTPNTSISVNKIEGKNIISAVTQKTDTGGFYTFQGLIYVRLGSTNKKLEAPEMLEFLQTRKLLCFDEMTTNAKIEEIDKELIKEYLKIRKQDDYLKSIKPEDFLINSGLAKKNGVISIKNSGILIFGRNPIKFFPQIELKLVKFSGTEAVNITSHKVVSLVLPKQIEETLSFIRKNISKEIRIGSEAKRKEVYEYPLKVIRESIVNAVAHRDYFSKDSIQVSIFEDRIEIVSPGTLPTGLTRELLGTLSVKRNPLTYKFLRDYRYVEGLGTGIPRMRNGMREHGLPDPVFDVTPNFFRVILKNKKAGIKPIESIEDLNERQKKALKYVLQHKSIKSDVYAEINSVSHATAVHEINEMIKFKYLKKIGAYRGAYYVLGERDIKK